MVRKRTSGWGLAEAKARLSEVLERSERAPQIIKRRSRAVAVVSSLEDFEALEARARAGSAQQRMKRFLDASAAVRSEGGVELKLATREPRKSPFART